jgi:hypothetical protein
MTDSAYQLKNAVDMAGISPTSTAKVAGHPALRQAHRERMFGIATKNSNAIT